MPKMKEVHNVALHMKKTFANFLSVFFSIVGCVWMIGKVWDSQKIIGDELVLRVLFFSWRQWLKNLISEKKVNFFFTIM